MLWLLTRWSPSGEQPRVRERSRELRLGARSACAASREWVACVSACRRAGYTRALGGAVCAHQTGGWFAQGGGWLPRANPLPNLSQGARIGSGGGRPRSRGPDCSRVAAQVSSTRQTRAKCRGLSPCDDQPSARAVQMVLGFGGGRQRVACAARRRTCWIAAAARSRRDSGASSSSDSNAAITVALPAAPRAVAAA